MRKDERREALIQLGARHLHTLLMIFCRCPSYKRSILRNYFNRAALQISVAHDVPEVDREEIEATILAVMDAFKESPSAIDRITFLELQTARKEARARRIDFDPKAPRPPEPWAELRA